MTTFYKFPIDKSHVSFAVKFPKGHKEKLRVGYGAARSKRKTADILEEGKDYSVKKTRQGMHNVILLKSLSEGFILIDNNGK